MTPDEFSAISHFCVILEAGCRYGDEESDFVREFASLLIRHREGINTCPPEIVKGACLLLLDAQARENGAAMALLVGAAEIGGRARPGQKVQS